VNTRDPRKISPFSRNDKKLSLRAWRPFDFAQDMLGAMTFFCQMGWQLNIRDKSSHSAEESKIANRLSCAAGVAGE
jgi:hypothetical protein